MGLVIPFIMLLTSRWNNLNTMFYATAMMMFGIFFMRYDLIVLGQVVPQYAELGVKEYPGLLPYMPSFHEIGLVVAGMALTVTTFIIGEKVFEGHKSEIH